MLRLLPYLLLSLLLPACTPQIVPPPPSADQYLQEGESLYADKRYEDAIATWEKVRDTFTSPEKTALAQFRIGETQFIAEMYPEAAATFEEFIKQHPEHPRTDEALYLLGLAYYRQRLASDQDRESLRRVALGELAIAIEIDPGVIAGPGQFQGEVGGAAQRPGSV